MEVAQLAAEADLATLALLHDPARTKPGAETESSDDEDDSALNLPDTAGAEAGPEGQSRLGGAAAGVNVEIAVDGGLVRVSMSVLEPGAASVS